MKFAFQSRTIWAILFTRLLVVFWPGLNDFFNHYAAPIYCLDGLLGILLRVMTKDKIILTYNREINL